MRFQVIYIRQGNWWASPLFQNKLYADYIFQGSAPSEAFPAFFRYLFHSNETFQPALEIPNIPDSVISSAERHTVYCFSMRSPTDMEVRDFQRIIRELDRNNQAHHPIVVFVDDVGHWHYLSFFLENTRVLLVEGEAATDHPALARYDVVLYQNISML